MLSASAEIKPSTVNGLSGEEFADLIKEDIKELLREESLNEEELLEFIDSSTSNMSVEEYADNKYMTNFISMMKKMTRSGYRISQMQCQV